MMAGMPPHPPVDPELSAALAVLGSGQQPPFRLETLAAVREQTAALRLPDEVLRRDGTVELTERTIPGPPGAPGLRLLILHPAGAQDPGPGVYHIHGGGMVLGDRRTGADEIAAWVAELGLVAVSVEYRLAPEHPHPAPVEDCYAGLAWTAAHARELGIEPSRLVIAGASAGGGLAAATALLSRDRGGPALSHQILMGPMLDDRGITPSSREPGGEGAWDRAANQACWTALLGESCGSPGVSPYAAPARAGDLSGLPAAYIDVGAAEIFRDEAIDYAARLGRAGVSVELHVWAGGCHGFEGMAPQAAVSRASRATRLGYLRRVLGR
jgi:acetyl esterase/lipase